MNTLLRKALTVIPVVGEVLLVVVLVDEIATRIKNRKLKTQIVTNKEYSAREAEDRIKSKFQSDKF